MMADLELARLAVPRRTYTMSHIEYTVDRIAWLYRHRELIHGLKFVQEPPVLRFFFGRLGAGGRLGRWNLRPHSRRSSAKQCSNVRHRTGETTVHEDRRTL